MILWIIIGIFAAAAGVLGFLAAYSLTPGGTNDGDILFIPAIGCAAIAALGVLVKVAVHFPLKI